MFPRKGGLCWGLLFGSLFALSFRYELLPTSHFDAGQEQAYYKAHCDNYYSYEEEVGHLLSERKLRVVDHGLRCSWALFFDVCCEVFQ